MSTLLLTHTQSLEAPEGRADKIAAQAFDDISRTRIKNLILEGCFAVNGVCVQDPSTVLKGGDVLCLHVPAAVDQAEGPEPENIPLDILYEDADLLVINKAAGMVVHPAPGHSSGTLVNALLSHCGEQLSGIGGVRRPGIVHRLDKETSGVMVVAKNDHAHQSLSDQLASRTLSRIYEAVLWGRLFPFEGTIEGAIGRHVRDRKKMALVRRGGKAAVTHYTVLQSFETIATHVECRLETGRTHQIRVHMQSKGCPVVGDELYSSRIPRYASHVVSEAAKDFFCGTGRHALHAREITFIHPSTKEVKCIKTNLPSDMERLLTFLKNQSEKGPYGL